MHSQSTQAPRTEVRVFGPHAMVINYTAGTVAILSRADATQRRAQWHWRKVCAVLHGLGARITSEGIAAEFDCFGAVFSARA